MLPKKRRIKKREFSELLARGAYGASPLFSVRIGRSEPNTPTTFAIVVSKKVSAMAVDRNKLRRRCYHVLRDLAPKIKDSHKIVFFVKKGVEKLSFAELSENIRAILERGNLIP